MSRAAGSATGLVGHEICRQLAESGGQVRALVGRTSDEGKRAELERLGIELVDGDFKDPASLARACAGVQAVVSRASSTFSRQAGDSIDTVGEQGASFSRAARGRREPLIHSRRESSKCGAACLSRVKQT
jgi:uncharacterized protein YbjT (DUF2867 family)